MPAIFRGIHLDPLQPANSFYLLWMILGFLVVTSVLIVSLGRLGDMYGRVRMYNLGFVIYTVASLLLTIDWMTGQAGAMYLIVFRIVQGIGAAFLLANAAAIITDAFPANQRGMALGINNIVGVSGMFVGLVLGGVLAPIDWRLVFLISVPVGLFGTVWAYLKLEERSMPRRAPVDWWGNVTFALGLILIMVSVTYGIRPYGASEHRLGEPPRDRAARAPASRQPDRLRRDRAARGREPDVPPAAVSHPRVHVRHAFDVPLGRRARRADVHADHLAAGHLAARARRRLRRHAAAGGPLHAAVDARHAGRRADVGLPVRPLRRALVRHRRDARLGLGFGLLRLLPIDFSFGVFALVLFMMGASMGLFASPNRAAVMNSLPPQDRGAGGGMNQTFQNSAQVLSVGHLLHADDPRAGVEPAARALSRAAGARRLGGERRTAPRTCRRYRSCSPPSSASTRSNISSARTCSPRCRPAATRC